MRRRAWAWPVLALPLVTAADGELDARLLLTLAVILVGARLAGALFERLRLPVVLGELVAGIALGNLHLLGCDAFALVRTDPGLGFLAELGVIVLLFQVGLESDLIELARTGTSALLVAVIGVIAPLGLGYAVHAWVAPAASWPAHLFVGSTLAATSVAITARVLRDLGAIDSPTARVILGAAVIDDVLGLIVLALVSGAARAFARGEVLDGGAIALVAGKAAAFLLGALALGRPAGRLLVRAATALAGRGALLPAMLGFCLLSAWLAARAGLHPIVGAFAAGLVLDAVHYRAADGGEPLGLEVQLRHVAALLVPVFFVVTGARVELEALADPAVLGLAGLLTVAAIAGKQACALAAFGDGVDRLSVAIGMIPRGEVGLIFASVGTTLVIGGQPVVAPATYAAVVLMVLATTLLAPPLLVWAQRRNAA